MKTSQIISMWIFSTLWAVTLGIWFIIDSSSYSSSWGGGEFLQATFFWAVFGILTHISLGVKKSKSIDSSSREIKTSNNKWKYLIWGMVFALITSGIREVSSRNPQFEFSLASIFGICMMGLIYGGIAYLIWGRKKTVTNGVAKKTDNRLIDSDKDKDITHNIEYFYVPTAKLITLWLCTFGLYAFYWFYKNWKCVRDKGNENVSPFLRAWFGVFTCYGLFKRILLSAEAQEFKPGTTAGILATAFILISIGYKAPDPYWIISFLNFVPILEVQKAIKHNNKKQSPDFKPNKKFSWKEITIIVLGGILLALAVWGAVIPTKNGLVKEMYKNGSVKTEMTYKDDILEGVAKGYYETGEIEWEQTYVDNKVNGIAKSYRKNGQLEAVVNFADDKENGEALFYNEDGNLVKKVVFNNGVEISTKEYDEYGNLFTPELNIVWEAMEKAANGELDMKNAYSLLKTMNEGDNYKDLSLYRKVMHEGYASQLYKEASDLMQSESYDLSKEKLEELRSILLSNPEHFGITEDELNSFLLIMNEDFNEHGEEGVPATEYAQMRDRYIALAHEYFKDEGAAGNMQMIIDSFMMMGILDLKKVE